ncbi:MAG: hypothetical protein PHY93_05515 [Bacteriovorax sp.]|nr:hypothetical protein [Bacteriovorax sp.]
MIKSKNLGFVYSVAPIADEVRVSPKTEKLMRNIKIKKNVMDDFFFLVFSPTQVYVGVTSIYDQ